MARNPKLKKPDEGDMLKRINNLLQRCLASKTRCESLGDCHLNLDDETRTCEEQIAVLTALKKKLYPNEP